MAQTIGLRGHPIFHFDASPSPGVIMRRLMFNPVLRDRMCLHYWHEGRDGRILSIMCYCTMDLAQTLVVAHAKQEAITFG